MTTRAQWMAEINKLEVRVAELEAWQLAIAEGTGFINRAEGQDGYKVADPKTILRHFEEIALEADCFRGALEQIESDHNLSHAECAVLAAETLDPSLAD